MKKLLFFVLLLGFSASVFSQAQKVEIQTDNSGQRLTVNGQSFMVNGMNWDYFPIGTNYSYSLWTQSDDFIKTALDSEMSLLKNMGVNTIRVYTGIPAKWIKYIYENYGIYTMLNHSFGRYGLTLKGAWVQNTDYANALTQECLLEEVKDMAQQYKNTPGLLLYLLGNENNYGLFWDGAETEDIPIEDRKSTQRARDMYQLFNKAAVMMKGIDQSHPIAICNGDLLFLDLINEECKDVDILGTNMYRGKSFGDAFQKVKSEYGKPILFTEFGADAFNVLSNEEDQSAQAYYLVDNWKEIYENAAGVGKVGNSLGGFTFQFSDGWWKYGQTSGLDVHDTHASWSNGGYLRDFEHGENNMNEEWFGICAKGETDASGHYQLYPRAAYYALKELHKSSPFQAGITSKSISNAVTDADLTDAMLRARGDKAALEGEKSKLLGISKLRADLTTYSTGGNMTMTPKDETDTYTSYPNKQGFDHMESFYIGVEANPAPNMNANVEFNILGNVATNPIDEIFYENRGRPETVILEDGTRESLNSLERVSLYRASYKWDSKWFTLDGFYRTGHYHWGYEGDFFGLYPEANYGPNIDIYNGKAPIGFEIAGKKALDGLKVAFGPELWWGANPAILVKYRKSIGKFNLTGIYHEDLDQQSNIESSFAIPTPMTRRVTLAIDRKFNKFGFSLGGIWAGQPLNGRVFQAYRDGQIYQDEIGNEDNWGGKVKFTFDGGKFKWYGQAAAMGLVANGGADYTQTFTGWTLKDSGSGNQYNVLSGLTYNISPKFQIAPNFIWQKPIEGPIPSTVADPGRPRNILDDPFAVRMNREMTAGELLLTYDPTPSTWMYSWDSDRIEDADLAFSAGFVYRHLPTIQDAGIGILPDGRTTFAFPGSAPAQDLWETNVRVVSKVSHDFGVIGKIYFGDAQANGDDTRTIHRFGTEVRMIYKKFKLESALKLNDWGPYDYYRDFNFTFPTQFVLDLSTSLGKPDWYILPGTRIGVRGTYRTMNQYSSRYAPVYTINAAGEWVPDATAIGFPDGNEWEIRTYIQINLGK